MDREYVGANIEIRTKKQDLLLGVGRIIRMTDTELLLGMLGAKNSIRLPRHMPVILYVHSNKHRSLIMEGTVYISCGEYIRINNLGNLREYPSEEFRVRLDVVGRPHQLD